MPYEFYGDETPFTSHETISFSLLAMSAKLMIFNAMKLSMKPPLRLTFLRNEHLFQWQTIASPTSKNIFLMMCDVITRPEKYISMGE